VSSGATVAVPDIVGVVLLVFCGATVGAGGGVVSMISSPVVVSVLALPAASMTVTVTG